MIYIHMFRMFKMIKVNDHVHERWLNHVVWGFSSIRALHIHFGQYNIIFVKNEGCSDIKSAPKQWILIDCDTEHIDSIDTRFDRATFRQRMSAGFHQLCIKRHLSKCANVRIDLIELFCIGKFWRRGHFYLKIKPKINTILIFQFVSDIFNHSNYMCSFIEFFVNSYCRADFKTFSRNNLVVSVRYSHQLRITLIVGKFQMQSLC